MDASTASDPGASPTSERTDVIGFVGLGGMGTGMATNLSKFIKSEPLDLLTRPVQPTLHIYNRDSTKCEALLNNPSLACQQQLTLQDMAKTANIVFIMVANDTAVKAVVSELLNPLGDDASTSGTERIIIDSSTVLPETTQEMVNLAAAQGVQYLACPVLGRPDAALAARLVIFAAGPESAKAHIMPYLCTMSRKIVDLGSTAPQAHVMKLVANFHVAAAIEVLAEGMTLAEKNGIQRSTYMDFIEDFFPSAVFSGYGRRIAEDQFSMGAGFTVNLGLKDVGHMRRLAELSSSQLPIADLAFNHLLAARAQGHADKDWAAIALAVRHASGLTLESPHEPREGDNV